MGASGSGGTTATSGEGLGEAAAGSPQRAFIDSSGNLRQPGRGIRGTELPMRDAESGSTYYQGMNTGSTSYSPQPRDNGAWWNLRTCFPHFRWNTVLGVTVALQLVTYVASCWLVTPREALEPSNGALWKLGSSNYIAERCAVAIRGKFLVELRRLFVPIFLHANILHILLNLYFEFVSGQRAMEKYGQGRFSLIFFLAGVGGNLLSDAFETNGVGASTACYGLIGADFAQAWLLWNLPGREEWQARRQQQLLQTAGMLFFWEVINWKTIDHYGHGGGFLSGFMLAVLLARPTPEEPLPPTFQGKARACFAVLLLGTVACVVKIFFWGSQATAHLGGRDVPWSVVCESVWREYSATG